MKIFFLFLYAIPLLAASSSRSNPDISLVRVPHGGIQPQAVMDRGGMLHLLYYTGAPAHGDLFYVTSSDSGIKWTMPLRVNSEAGTATAQGAIRGGQIAIGPNGGVYVAWNGSSKAEAEGPLDPESGKRGAPLLYSRLNSTHTAFEPERNLMTHTFGLDGGGAVAADSAGNVYVAWHGKATGSALGDAGRQVWIAASHDNGKTFSAEYPAWKNATGACGCCDLSIYADSKGTLRVLYRSATENIHRDIYLLTSLDHGRNFAGRKLHDWQINACPMSSMAFSEADGKVEGAWETKGQVYFEDVTAAQAAPISAPGDGKRRKYPHIAIAPDGETLLVWTASAGMAQGGLLAWQLFDATGQVAGEAALETHADCSVPAKSFGAVVAKPATAKRGGFIILY
jgi:hypothetical protein